MAAIEFSDVAAALSCEQFARRELEMRGRRAKCPWCANPEHYNLAFLPDGRAYCHKCHKSGDVVTLAAQVWKVDQLTAARGLNDDFKLGLTASRPTDEQRRQRQRERDQREAEQQRQREEWARAADDLREAEQAADGLTLADADNPLTWAKVARLGRALDKWNALRAGV